MNNFIEGKAFVVGDNIDTDQIIPARYLVYSLSVPEERKKYGEYAMLGLPEDLYPLRFVEEGESESQYDIIVAGKNFGSGSSREHAPACLGIAGIKAIIASSYSRIFYRNSINGAFLIPLEFDSHAQQAHDIKTGDILRIDLITNSVINKTRGERAYPVSPLGDAGDIIAKGGIFEYAKQSVG